MLVNVSKDNHPVRPIRFVVVMLCACVLSPQVFGQETKEAYELAQNKQTLALKRLNNPLLKPEIVLGFKAIERDYRNILRGGTNGRNEKELDILRRGIEYRIFTLSDSDIQADSRRFGIANQTLQRELAGAGNPAQMPNPQQRQQFRELVYTEAMKLFKTMLNEGNFLARSAAVQRLLDLEAVPKRGQARLKMFADVHLVYLSILRDPKQPDSIKAITASAIRVYLQKADAVSTVELQFAEAILSELARPNLSAAYQISLLQALEEIRVPRRVSGKKEPLIICGMANLMTDQTADIQVRCRAARVMGRCGWDRQIKYNVLAWAVADLTTETALLFNQAKNKNDPKWGRCGWSLYTAFHHEGRQEVQGKGPGPLPKGFLNRDPASTVVRDAYANGVPVMAHLMFNNNAVGARIVGPLFGWANKNRPKSLIYDPSCPAFPVKQPAGGAAQQGG